MTRQNEAGTIHDAMGHLTKNKLLVLCIVLFPEDLWIKISDSTRDWVSFNVAMVAGIVRMVPYPQEQ